LSEKQSADSRRKLNNRLNMEIEEGRARAVETGKERKERAEKRVSMEIGKAKRMRAESTAHMRVNRREGNQTMQERCLRKCNESDS